MTERFDKCFIRPSCPVRPLIRLASRATFPVGEGFERLLQVFCNSPTIKRRCCQGAALTEEGRTGREQPINTHRFLGWYTAAIVIRKRLIRNRGMAH